MFLLTCSENSDLSGKPQGFNPLRWVCEKQGCFNLKRRPKIEVFAECFPRRINFGDVDGIVEINGKALFLEWKGHEGDIPTGQRIMHERLTCDGKFTTICIVGNAETMECSSYGLFFNGKWCGYKKGNLETIKNVIKKWVQYAERRSA